MAAEGRIGWILPADPCPQVAGVKRIARTAGVHWSDARNGRDELPVARIREQAAFCSQFDGNFRSAETMPSGGDALRIV